MWHPPGPIRQRRAAARGVLVLWLCSGFATQAWAWQFVIQGKGSDYPLNAQLDPSGDLIVRGYSSENDEKDARPVILKVDATTGREVWRAPASLSGSGMTLDGLGNPILAGGGNRLRIAKYSAFTGFEIWRITAKGSSTGRYPRNSARAAVVDSGGDIIVAGHLDSEGAGQEFAVLKVSGTDGAEHWRWTLDGGTPCDSAWDVTVDASGDVIAVGGHCSTAAVGDFTVVKLSGSAGNELWRAEIDGTSNANDRAYAVVLDEAGNALVAGHITNVDTGSDLAVVKFEGTTGAELWRAEVDGGYDQATSLLLDGSGDVIAAGKLGQSFGVVKLSGASGAELWRALTVSGEVHSVAVDGSGDVFAAGELDGTRVSYHSDYLVAKYSGATGTELWRSRLYGSIYSDNYAEAKSVIVAASGEVIVAGRLTDFKTGLDFVLRSLRNADGVNPRPAGAKRFILREKTGVPGSRKLVLGSRDAGQIYRNPAAKPTDVGASLEITNPTTGESASIALPAQNWEMIRGTGRPEFYRPFKRWLYLDPLQVDGPCTKLVVHSRGLRVVCSGAQIPFTLDESPGQGSLEVRLKFGGDGGTEFCWVFEGDAVKGDKSTTDGPVGRFGAHKAPPPVGCPIP